MLLNYMKCSLFLPNYIVITYKKINKPYVQCNSQNKEFQKEQNL